MTESPKAEWWSLKKESDDSCGELIPKCVVKHIDAPSGYVAIICAKQFPVYRGSFEIKAKAIILNESTQEVKYESQWASVEGTQKRLQKALEAIGDIVAYRAAMEAKTKPVSQATSLF